MTPFADRLRAALDATERLARLVEYPGHGGSKLLLRTIAAHRTILDLHPADSTDEPLCDGCGGAYHWPCPTLRALAEAYGVEA